MSSTARLLVSPPLLHQLRRTTSLACALGPQQQQKKKKKKQQPHPHQPARPFLSSALLSPPTQHITASRTLPYPSLPIYLTIANVGQYATFLPYCLASTVTHWSQPDRTLQRRWPERAELEVGWGAVRERFASRIYCVPGRVVEAVAGDGVASVVGGREIEHHSHVDSHGAGGAAADASGAGEILSRLVTRWEVQPLQTGGAAGERTKVTLSVEVKFANPVYAAMSQVAADKVADKMIEAFEARVEQDMRNSKMNGEAGHEHTSAAL